MNSDREADSSDRARAISEVIHASGCLDDGESLPISLLEVAPVDLRILTDRPLSHGTAINLMLRRGNTNHASLNVGTVHWSQARSNGWQLGLHLQFQVSESLVNQSWLQLRNSIRFDCHWAGWAQNSDGQSNRILIRDYSLSGLKFESLSRFDEGAELRISQSESPEPHEFVTARVARADDSACVYGCALLFDSGRQLSQMFYSDFEIQREAPFLSGLKSSKKTSQQPENQSIDVLTEDVSAAFA